jgi:outer membrane protein TolC
MSCSLLTAKPRTATPTAAVKARASKHDYLKEEKVMRTKAVLLVLSLLIAVLPVQAQLPGPGSTSTTNTSSNDQQRIAPDTIAMPPQLQQFSGSGAVDKLVPGVIRISLLDALDRGLKHNLGLLLSQAQTGAARAQHWRSLSSLLPNASFRTAENIQRINLAAFGIPFTVNGSTVVGPFAVFDARPSVTQRLLDFSSINRLRSADELEKAANFNVRDARELVVLVVGNEYLLTLASATRLDTAKAQFATSQTIFQQTQDLKKSGMVAGIDVLRAQVQMQQQQQRVLSAENQLERQRMTFARVIGIPVSQQFELTDQVPYTPLPEMNIEESLARAYQRRPEYLAAEARLRAAEMQLKAAKDERLPTIEANGDYGALGRSPGDSRATYSVSAGVRIPIFQGGRVKADILDAQTLANQLRMQLQDLHSRIEFEVRSSALDVKTSNDQVAVARQSIDLASDELKQAQDRFAAGVAGTLDVVQAQESVAIANETYIQALYLNNVAKLTLARALGVAEQQTRTFLGGR